VSDNNVVQVWQIAENLISDVVIDADAADADASQVDAGGSADTSASA
jgi:hypothetical protein